jgi:DNA mismatch repair ATPase MutL
LLRHQVPDGELAVLIERAVDLLIDHCMKRRFAQTRTPETRSAVKSSRAQPHPTNASTSQPHAANSGATQPHTARSSAGQSKTASPHRADNACVGVCGLTDAARLAEGSVVRSSSASSSRYIPRAVVREVHQRDAGQCTFISADGKRCAERGFLELHHHELPYARGGEATIENLRLVCRAHNALFAERDFGRTWMRSKRTQRGSSSANSVQNR